MEHELKIERSYFVAVLEKRKTFEIRRNDRGFNAGDAVLLREIEDTGTLMGRLTGRKIRGNIGYVTGFQQKEDYVVFSLLSPEEVSE